MPPVTPEAVACDGARVWLELGKTLQRIQGRNGLVPPINPDRPSPTCLVGCFPESGVVRTCRSLPHLLTLLKRHISSKVRSGALRNVTAKAPAAVPHLRVLLETVFSEDASPAGEPPEPVALLAAPKDRPILAAALAQQRRYLVTLY
jgi:hypothetical protein